MAFTPSSRFTLSSVATATWLLCAGALAQTTTLAPVTITGRSDPPLSVSGWGDIPLSETPLQASIVHNAQMRDRGTQRLADVVRADAGVSDSYNSEGYWDFLSVRGFVLDNRFNYRRDGLPINAETSIPLDNKERIEILKGTSGMQAGTSAPGGLVNLVVKRPTDAPLYSATLGWRDRGSVLGGVDLGQRFGAQQAFGVRLNVAYEHLDPQLRNARGKRHVAAIAGDWRLGSDTLIEAEYENSRRSQPSQPGFSMQGDRLPEPANPLTNLNNQPWSQPVVMDADTASLRVTHKLEGWQLSAHGMTQRLHTDDRLAFPYGCGAEGNYDRYCSNGIFDLYDFRSENERRHSDALELAARGTTTLAGMAHNWAFGSLSTRYKSRLQPQAYNYAGIGRDDGSVVVPAAPIFDDENTNRDERSTELFVRDAVRMNDAVTVWGGLRHVRLDRRSVLTSGAEGTAYEQSFTTPFVATSYTFAPSQIVYASWSRGNESDVAPNQPQYTNRAQALPAARSRQIELGLKVATVDAGWGFAWFDIKRPAWDDVGACDGTDDTCTRVLDGHARHQGFEANAAWRTGAWAFQGSLQALRARTGGSNIDPANNGRRPTNVPHRTAKVQARYHLPQIAGLSVQADALGVSDRAVLEDNSVSIPGYGVADLALRYEQKGQARTVTWRAGVDNVFDRRAWRESPFQFGHVYLYPLAGRTFRVSVEASL